MTKPLSKDSIIRAYRDCVKAANGAVVGEDRFVKETSLSRFNWLGKYWSSWSALQADAGYAPNVRTQRVADEVLLRRFAELALEKGRVPTQPDLVRKRREDSSFPDKRGFRRWGNRDALLKRVSEYCQERPELAEVLAWLDSVGSESVDRRLHSFDVRGFVYLLRSGRKYKLGRSNAVGRRLRELSIQLPQKPDTIHVIETDDPEGIEAYWHGRFKDKREGGEWFALSPDDVQAFKRRRRFQ